ncbi:MAG: hypothetical protein LQ350_001036 [Teloschistes chrysophthalmus]|nr:MAG: hypothetical protein LQ350_001036 [Niorma chrysophthalma]
MRLHNLAAIAGAVVLAHQGLADFSLSQLQPIAGFSDACTEAYNTPLTDCTISDFYRASSCSPQCVASLEARTIQLNKECRGTTAFPNTLIGMFFQKTAVEKLCATVEASPNSSADQGSEPLATISPPTSSASSAPFTQGSMMPFASASATASSQPSSTAASTGAQTTTTTAFPSSLSTSATSVTSTTLTSVLVASTSSAGSGNGIESVSASSNTPTSASSSSDTSANPTGPSQSNDGGGRANNNGNGGTVLDAASAANIGARASYSLSSVVVALVAALWIS